MEYVLDSSVALAWLFEDEVEPLSEQLLELLPDATPHVPALWIAEVCNALLVARRRGRIEADAFRRCVADALALPVIVNPPQSEQEVHETLRIAQKHNLSAYDAAYLELALRHLVPLATLDQQLAKAAGAEKALLMLDARES